MARICPVSNWPPSTYLSTYNRIHIAHLLSIYRLRPSVQNGFPREVSSLYGCPLPSLYLGEWMYLVWVVYVQFNYSQEHNIHGVSNMFMCWGRTLFCPDMIEMMKLSLHPLPLCVCVTVSSYIGWAGATTIHLSSSSFFFFVAWFFLPFFLAFAHGMHGRMPSSSLVTTSIPPSVLASAFSYSS